MAEPKSTPVASWRDRYPVHPAADKFPMLDDDELNDLATDIKANGLLYPIIVKAGVLVDGRNRLEACRRAGVEPRVEELNDIDATAYILATNVNRRHLSKGQRAMAVAMLYPDAEKGGRGKNSKLNLEFSNQYVSQARTVLRWLPELADHVFAGTKPLNDAYAEALRKKEQTEPRPVSSIRAKRQDTKPIVGADLNPHTDRSSTSATSETPSATPPSTYEWVDQQLTEGAKLLDRAMQVYAALDAVIPKLTRAERTTLLERWKAARRCMDQRIIRFGSTHKPEPEHMADTYEAQP